MKRLALAAALVGAFAVTASVQELSGQERELGPVDGRDLPGTDLERIVAGVEAPDFTAVTLAGERLTLSGFRGERNVVLFFYRGQW